MDSADKKARETSAFLDNLTDFVTDDEEREMAEILESLQAEGIDPEKSLRQFHQVLSEYAPTWREKAARERGMIEAFFESQKAKVRRSRVEIQGEIHEVVQSMLALGAPVEAGAYHRKFEEARDEDLESLLEDIRFQRDLLLKKQDKADSNG